MPTPARVIGVYIVVGTSIIAIVLMATLTHMPVCCSMQIVIAGWLIMTMLGSAACAGAVLLPFFTTGHVDSFWKQSLLFASAGVAFFYLLLFHVFRFEGP